MTKKYYIYKQPKSTIMSKTNEHMLKNNIDPKQDGVADQPQFTPQQLDLLQAEEDYRRMVILGHHEDQPNN